MTESEPINMTGIWNPYDVLVKYVTIYKDSTTYLFNQNIASQQILLLQIIVDLIPRNGVSLSDTV